LARTDTFMPMKPAAPDRMPPMAKPTATEKSWMKISATNSTTPTRAMIWYCRVR